jgi:hypothetical protein
MREHCLISREMRCNCPAQNQGLGIDVEKSSSHHLSQIEIASDNPCYQQLSDADPDIPILKEAKTEYAKLQ